MLNLRTITLVVWIKMCNFARKVGYKMCDLVVKVAHKMCDFI